MSPNATSRKNLKDALRKVNQHHALVIAEGSVSLQLFAGSSDVTGNAWLAVGWDTGKGMGLCCAKTDQVTIWGVLQQPLSPPLLLSMQQICSITAVPVGESSQVHRELQEQQNCSSSAPPGQME